MHTTTSENTAIAGARPHGGQPTAGARPHDGQNEQPRPVCPRCRHATGLRLDRPPDGRYNAVYRCDGRLNGCGYLWSPASPSR